MATDKPRYSITVDTKLLEQIEDFRYSNRIPTRAEATTELIRLGLERLKEQSSLDKELNGEMLPEKNKEN